jgi:spore germination cell wall hydrolase CwlJ-like protein
MKKRLLISMLILGNTFLNEPNVSPSTAQISHFKNKAIEYQNYFDEPEKTKELKKKIEDIYNYRTSNFNEDSDSLLLARMLLGEAAGCSKIEKIAIAYTAIRRADDNKKWNGKTLKEAILVKEQYSCFNKGTDSSIFLKNPLRYDAKEFRECLNLSREILEGKYEEPIKATHYYNPNLVKRPNSWKDLKKIGRIKVGQTKNGKPIWSKHIFYEEL